MADPEQAFPFPFFGAGEADYYMWAEVHVRFGREPTSSQREVIVGTVPAPLRNAVDWCEGRQLLVASGLFLHGAVIRAYAAAGGEPDRIGEDGWLYAAPSRIAALNADIEDGSSGSTASARSWRPTAPRTPTAAAPACPPGTSGASPGCPASCRSWSRPSTRAPTPRPWPRASWPWPGARETCPGLASSPRT